MNAQIYTLTDQVATLAVSMDSLIHAVERTERSIERMAVNLENSISVLDLQKLRDRGIVIARQQRIH